LIPAESAGNSPDNFTEGNEGNEGSSGFGRTESSKAQLLSYMKLLDIPIGRLIKFHEPVLKNGFSRMILPGANPTEESDGDEVLL
jgi:hypothetical protein